MQEQERKYPPLPDRVVHKAALGFMHPHHLRMQPAMGHLRRLYGNKAYSMTMMLFEILVNQQDFTLVFNRSERVKIAMDLGEKVDDMMNLIHEAGKEEIGYFQIYQVDRMMYLRSSFLEETLLKELMHRRDRFTTFYHQTKEKEKHEDNRKSNQRPKEKVKPVTAELPLGEDAARARKDRPKNLSEVVEYFKECGYVDAAEALKIGKKFMDYYEGIGWVIGKDRKPVKDWRACVRTWVSRDDEKRVVPSNTGGGDAPADPFFSNQD